LLAAKPPDNVLSVFLNASSTAFSALALHWMSH
jgi:hypothetical protein